MAKIRTIDGKVVVGIHVDFDIKCPNKPLFGREKFEEKLQRKAMKAYGNITQAMNDGLIDMYNKFFDGIFPDFDGTEYPNDLALYDDGLSGNLMHYAEMIDISVDGMILVRADCHTATYTFFDEPTGALVAMHVGKIQPIGEEDNYDL